MKRKRSLEKAIILGLILSTSICGSAWAAAITVNDGTGTDIAKETSNITNGEYSKDYGSEDIDVTGVGLLAAESNAPIVNKFTLTTTGDFNVTKESINGAGGSGVRGTINFYNVNYKIDGIINADNIHLTQTFFPKYGGGVQGINLITKGNFDENPTLTLTASGNVSFENFDESIVLQKNTELYIDAEGDITFDIDKSKWSRLDYAYGVRVTGGTNNTNKDNSDVNIKLMAENINFNDMYQAINFAGNNIDMNLIANNSICIRNEDGSRSNAIQFDNKNFFNDSALKNNKKTIANLVAGKNITIDNYRTGISSSSDYPSFTLGSEINLYSNKIDITNTTIGISVSSDREVKNGENNVVKLDDYEAYEVGGNFERNNINTISASEKALNATDKAGIILNAATNRVVGAEEAVYANRNAEININGKENYIANSFADEQTGNGSYALHSQNKAKITVDANEINNIIGDTEAVLAEDGGIVNISSKNNYIANSIENSNGITTFNNKESYALHAKDGGNISVTAEEGGINQIESDGFRTVYAEGSLFNKSDISISGAVKIQNKNFDSEDENVSKIAVVASGQTLGKGTVNIDLKGTEGNLIQGSVIAGQNGIVNINTNLPEGASTFSRSGDSGKGSIAVYGNVMAGNNGELNLDLGAGGYLSGRVDDYQDAAVNGKHEEFFNPEFSKKITDSGTVNLTMGEGSTWDVTGQSWVTKLEGSGTVDMRNGSVNETSHAVHIGTLKGDHTFVMDLDSDNHNISDMLFISDEAESKGKQTIYLNSVSGLDTMADGEKLRFATVNAGTDKLTFVGEYNGENSYENHKNGVMVMDSGVLNTNFVIENEEYDETDAEQQNEGYNGGKDFNAAKPGDGYVDENYKDGINWYLTRNKAGDEISDAGKTIINMSKVNYSNAIYMDRLNKRLGEARYINPEEEQGMWVRLRHDRIGKDDAFRSQNTMYELGYDEKQSCDNGERRLGMAIDYMDGKAEYSGINGSGDIKRYGLWLYDTWLGDKGHYTDYVLKWGHLENDFDIYTMTRGEKVTGDYSNNVFSASAEYGKKNDMGNGWYFEPQAQLQFARVTGADYTTSQNTKVNLDGINSLIGRAGFRLGRDLNENSTVYIKADLLHEFLGEQDITAVDGTGTLRETYENEGTWYDVGFGFATALGHNSYAFMDFEKSFGNDNDETYQINAGVQWSF